MSVTFAEAKKQVEINIRALHEAIEESRKRYEQNPSMALEYGECLVITAAPLAVCTEALKDLNDSKLAEEDRVEALKAFTLRDILHMAGNGPRSTSRIANLNHDKELTSKVWLFRTVLGGKIDLPEAARGKELDCEPIR
jgi:hypothetical protein